MLVQGISLTLNGMNMPLPSNISDLTQRLTRNVIRRVIMVEYPDELEFTGAAYEYLRGLWCNDRCAVVTVEMRDTCGGNALPVLSGTMLLGDAKWHLNECRMECALQDTSVGKKLFNTMDSRVTPITTRSLNGVDVTAVTPIALTIPELAGAGTITRNVWDWFTCMAHAVAVITDGQVTIQSDWYTGLPQNERISLANCFHLRMNDLGNEGLPNYSVENLWLEVANRFNLWMVVPSLGGSTIYIAQEPQTFGSTVEVEAVRPEGLVQMLDEERLYSTIRVGDRTSKHNLTGAKGELPYLHMVGFPMDTLTVNDACARDLALDITGEWVADTNTIEGLCWIDTANEDSDEMTALIQYNASTNTAVTDSYYPGADKLYNVAMVNYNILQRYPESESIWIAQELLDASVRASGPAALGTLFNDPFLVDPTPFWRADETGTLIGTYLHKEITGIAGQLEGGNLVNFPDDFNPPNHDVWALWNSADRYIANADGLNNFALDMWVQGRSNNNWIAAGGGPVFSYFVRTRFKHYNAANVLLATYTHDSPVLFNAHWSLTDGHQHADMYPGTGIQHVQVGQSITMANTDYVDVESVFVFIYPQGGTSNGSIYFSGVRLREATNSDPLYDGMGTFADAFITVTNNGSFLINADGERRIVRYEFDRHVLMSDWVDLLNGPTGAVSIIRETGLTNICHAGTITRNIQDGETKFSIISTDRNRC